MVIRRSTRVKRRPAYVWARVRVCDVRVGCVRCRRVYWGVWVCMVLGWGVSGVGGCIGVCGCV